MTGERDPDPPRESRKRAAHRFRRRLQLRRRLKHPSPLVVFWGGVTAAVTGALLIALARRTVKAVVAFALLSLFLAYLVAPAARYLRRLAIRRRRSLSLPAALAIVYALCAMGIVLTRALIGERLLAQMARFTESVPGHVQFALTQTTSLDRWQQWFGWSRASSGTMGSIGLWLSDWVRVHVADALIDALDYAWILPWLFLVPVLSFGLLTQFSTFRRSTLRVLPAGHVRWRGSEFLEQVNTVLAGYVRAQVLSALTVGIVTSIGFAILKVPYALLVGLAAGALELIPVVGPIAAALLVVGFARGARLVIVLAFLLAVRIVQDTIVYPRLIGRRVHLPAIAVLVAVWVGATAGGILGVLLAVPAVAIGAVAFRQYRDYRAIERLVRAHAAAQASPRDSASPAGRAEG